LIVFNTKAMRSNQFAEASEAVSVVMCAKRGDKEEGQRKQFDTARTTAGNVRN
jgi:hypothetical protein